jgi:hypothetical protein
MEAAGASETSVKLYYATTQITANFVLAGVRTSNLTRGRKMNFMLSCCPFDSI